MSASIEQVNNQSFDYVIVGGGLAGLTLAARLSEDKDKTVCVLEAGGANLNDPMIVRTAGFGSQFGNKTYDWGHETTRQAAGDRAYSLARGRTLGGSSAINFMVYTKPPAEEVDDFERLGNPGWNWKNLQHYMNKAEGFVEANPEVQKVLDIPVYEGLGRDGPLAVTYPQKTTGLNVVVRDAMYKHFPKAKAPYNGDVCGTYLATNTHDPKTRTRSYSVSAYYTPNQDRENLTVLVDAQVNKVATETDGNGLLVAKAVEFEHGGAKCVVTASKEIILAAGALKSPAILEHSGIGRKEVLANAHVPQKLELPGVGENFQEHIIGGVSFELKDDVTFDTFDALRDPARLAEEVEKYEKGEDSLFTMGLTTVSFVPVDFISPRTRAIWEHAKNVIDDLDAAGALPAGLKEQYDIQLSRLKPGTGKGPQCEFLCFPGFNSQPNPPAEGKRYVTIAPGMNHMFSRGTIHITSNDPKQEPEIDPHYMEHDADLQVYTEMIKFVRKLADTSPMKDVIVKEVNPGPEVQTDEEIQQWLKNTFYTTWHTAATCSMLPKEKGGVVDPQLKVYGTSNLRIVDLSIIPLHFAAHTQALVYGVAEMGADIIKGTFVA